MNKKIFAICLVLVIASGMIGLAIYLGIPEHEPCGCPRDGFADPPDPSLPCLVYPPKFNWIPVLGFGVFLFVSLIGVVVYEVIRRRRK